MKWESQRQHRVSKSQGIVASASRWRPQVDRGSQSHGAPEKPWETPTLPQGPHDLMASQPSGPNC